MRPSLVRSALSVSVVAFASAAVHAQVCSNDSPLTAAAAFYKQRYDFIHDGAGSPPLTESLRTLVVANIGQNLNEGDVGAVDWDFWTDAQDGTSSPDAKASLVKQQGVKAVVRLQYQFRLAPESLPRAKAADVYLVRAGSGCWLVDDLRRNGKSLSAILRQGTRRTMEEHDG